MRQLLFALAMLILAVAAVAQEEDPDEMGLRYAGVQQDGIEQLKQYKWQTEIKMMREDEVKAEFTVANRLNEKGQMVQEVESAEASDRQKRGLRGRAQKQNAEDAGEFLNHVVQVMATYIFMSKGQEVDFFDKATITEGVGSDKGKLVVMATDVTVPKDVVTKWIDPQTLFPSKITFETVVDEVPVQGEVLYRPIENGPNVPRQATITIPAKKSVVTTEFLNYEKQL